MISQPFITDRGVKQWKRTLAPRRSKPQIGAMPKKLAIVQSNYIPWKGYLDLIAAVDEFILYDDVQFTKNDWRNRNQIKTPRGVEWLSVPVGQDIHRRIRDVEIATHDWQEQHWNKLVESYRDTPHFGEVAAIIEPLYRSAIHTNLSAMNREFLETILRYLSIATMLKYSWEYAPGEGQTQRLVSLCQQAGADTYISGPAARDYLDAEQFATAGIALRWLEYEGYPEYPQRWGAFTHRVSILDLLFNCGKDSPTFMQMGRT